MKYIIQNQDLIIENNNTNKIIGFKWPISKVEEFVDCLIVLLEPAINSGDNRNIFGLSFTGEVLWQIPEVSALCRNFSYTDIARSEDNSLYACNFSGESVWLCPKTGAVLKKDFTK
jgi:hypothetical protein